jgi:uncharacterized membrane protein
MLGLSPLGVFHTATGLVALIAGFWELARDKEITPKTLLGRLYVLSTLLSASTALCIHRHRGFSPAHGLAVLTLLAILLGTLCAFTSLFGRAARYLQAVCFSSTILFSLVPGVTETLMRFPRRAPLVPFGEMSALKPIYGALLVLFLVGLAFQLRWLRRKAGV